MSAASDRRQFSRIPVRLAVEISATDVTTFTGASRDVSLNGVYVLRAGHLPVGTDCCVCLLLGEPQSRLRVPICGRIARRDASGLAVEFTAIELESFNHLHALVLNNAADPARVEAEYKNHLGLKGLNGSETQSGE